MKYVKKPIPVTADQWWPGCDMPNVTEVRHTSLGLIGIINTLEGRMTVYPGSYVVTGPEGEQWPVKEEIFEKTYERYEE